MERVAIYVRDDFDAGQERLCLCFIDNHKAWDIAWIFRDEEFDEMIKLCREGKIDIIVTESMTRFSSDVTESLKITLKLLPTYVHFISENLSTKSKEGKIYVSTMIAAKKTNQ